MPLVVGFVWLVLLVLYTHNASRAFLIHNNIIISSNRRFIFLFLFDLYIVFCCCLLFGFLILQKCNYSIRACFSLTLVLRVGIVCVFIYFFFLWRNNPFPHFYFSSLTYSNIIRDNCQIKTRLKKLHIVLYFIILSLLLDQKKRIFNFRHLVVEKRWVRMCVCVCLFCVHVFVYVCVYVQDTVMVWLWPGSGGYNGGCVPSYGGARIRRCSCCMM